MNSYTADHLHALTTDLWKGKTESDIAGMLGERWAGVSEIRMVGVSPQGSGIFIMFSLNGDRRESFTHTLEKQGNEWRVAR
jgi:hypothetical protein